MRNGIVYCLLTAVVDCMNPPALASGSVDTSRGTTYQSVAVYQCDEGYTLQGQAITACLENGTWSGPTPTCAREWTTQLGLVASTWQASHTTGPLLSRSLRIPLSILLQPPPPSPSSSGELWHPG